ncbi:hypothetical protein GCM10009741_26400 [Kribbella lupini]|uniref:Large ribosomal subunit protein bL36 n=1 Tax=Kribbella lupini TaxID=291602 RepID=A0ABP4LJE0_9ACTN
MRGNITPYGGVLSSAGREEQQMKVRNSLRALKARPGAQVVRRRGRVFVINRRDPRVKARQG